MYLNNTSCENDGSGQYIVTDGDGDQCIKYQKENGFSFAILWKERCYGSKACKRPLPLNYSVVYEVKNCPGITLDRIQKNSISDH